MNTISKFAAVVAVLLLASTASAGTLYWQVDDSELGESEYGWGAELWALNTTTNEKTSLSDGLIDAPTGIQQADITAYGTDSTFKFYVELVNYTTGASSDGYKWSYNELSQSGYIATNALDAPDVRATVAAHTNFAQAPEPTSGLLLLIGGSLLALRRRRRS